MADYLAVNVSDVKRFLRDLRASGLDSDVQMAKEFTKAFTAAGEIVAGIARSKASFSTRIPATIKTRRVGPAVRIIAGGKSAPNAAPIDHHGVTGVFRHPVFGNKNVWVNQIARPFLEPALEAGAPRAIAALNEELDRTYRKVWRHG